MCFFCAISVQATIEHQIESHNLVGPTNIFFITYFMVNVVGHLLGAWEPPEKKKARYGLAAANSLGIVIVILLAIIGVGTIWGTLLAFTVVIGLWWRIARGTEILNAVTAFYE